LKKKKKRAKEKRTLHRWNTKRFKASQSTTTGVISILGFPKELDQVVWFGLDGVPNCNIPFKSKDTSESSNQSLVSEEMERWYRFWVRVHASLDQGYASVVTSTIWSNTNMSDFLQQQKQFSK
jgi:hypothetical protein